MFHCLFHSISRLLEAYGKWSLSRKSTYSARFTGQWMNRGNDRNENWVWVEKVKPLRPVYVNVFNIGGDYIITEGYFIRPNAIDYSECEDSDQAKCLMEDLAIFYKHFGRVTICDEQVLNSSSEFNLDEIEKE